MPLESAPSSSSRRIRAAASRSTARPSLDVVEGLECAEQGEALRALRCVFGQRYHFARLCSPEDIAALLARQAGELAA